MEPEIAELDSVCGFGLGDFTFMMRKHKVRAATVNVKGLFQFGAGHGGTFDVPARPAFSPGTVPRRFAGFFFFPQRKIVGMSFFFIHFDASSGLKFAPFLVGKFSVFRKGFDFEVDSILGFVGVAFFDQFFDDLDHLGEVVRGFGLFGRRLDAQRGVVCHVFGNDAVREFRHADAFFVGAVDHFVINVRVVGHESDVFRSIPVLQIASNHIKRHGRASVSQMTVVVDGRTTKIHSNFSFDQWLECLQSVGQCVVYLKCHVRVR